jgi:hypothetical protein
MANGQFDYGQLTNLGMSMLHQRKMDQQQAIENQMAAQRLEMQKENNKRLQEQFELNRSIQMDQLFSSMAQKGVSESDAFKANPNWTPEQRSAYSSTLKFFKGQDEAIQKLAENNPQIAQMIALYRATKGVEGGGQAYQSMAQYVAPQGGGNWQAELLSKYSVIREKEGESAAKNYVTTIYGTNGKNLLPALQQGYKAKSYIADLFAQSNGAGQDPLMMHHFRTLALSNSDEMTTKATMQIAYDLHKSEIAKKEAEYESELNKSENAVKVAGQKDVIDYKENTPSKQIQKLNTFTQMVGRMPEIAGGSFNKDGWPVFNMSNPIMQEIQSRIQSSMGMAPSAGQPTPVYPPPQVPVQQTGVIEDGENFLLQ